MAASSLVAISPLDRGKGIVCRSLPARSTGSYKIASTPWAVRASRLRRLSGRRHAQVVRCFLVPGPSIPPIFSRHKPSGKRKGLSLPLLLRR